MTNTIKIVGLLLLLTVGQVTYGQSNKEKALAKGQQAIKLEDDGKIDEAIKLLEKSQKLDPDNISYPYELAYAYYAKKKYKQACKYLEGILKHKDVSDHVYQLLGNSYDLLGKTDKAFEIYDAGLKVFPKSGKLYLEKGNVYWNKKRVWKSASILRTRN